MGSHLKGKKMPSNLKSPGYKDTLVSIRHFFKPSYFNTAAELQDAYKPMIDWLDEHAAAGYKLYPMDNALYSDLNEDPYIGYVISFSREEDAVLFKMTWL